MASFLLNLAVLQGHCLATVHRVLSKQNSHGRRQDTGSPVSSQGREDSCQQAADLWPPHDYTGVLIKAAN